MVDPRKAGSTHCQADMTTNRLSVTQCSIADEMVVVVDQDEL